MPQVPQTITAATTRLMAGSSQVHPVSRIAPPASTTPADTLASASMCANAPRMLRSPFCPAISSHADRPLATMAMAATAITVHPATSPGSDSRRTASQAIAPVAISSSTALTSADRIEAERKP